MKEAKDDVPGKPKGITRLGFVLISILSVLIIGAAGFYVYTLGIGNTEARTEKVEVEKDVLVAGFTGDFTVQDVSPLVHFDDNTSVFKNVYSSLIYYDKEGKLIPQLAQSWHNDDNYHWTFKLRQDAKFSNGEDLTAEDVKWSLDSIHSNSDSMYQEYFSEIKEVKIIDRNTVQFITANPMPYLISKLSYLMIVPKDTKDITFPNALGSGPFKYSKEETVEGEQLVLDRNEIYWGTKPKVKKVIFKVYEDEEQKIADFLAGKIDLLDVQQPEDLEKVKSAKIAKNLTMNDGSVFYVQPNMSDNYTDYITGVTENPFKDKRVRLAMWKAIDTAALVKEKMQGMAVPASQIIPKTVFGYDKDLKRPEYNLEEARSLMKEAGYENGFGVKFEIVTVRQSIAEFIKEALKEINIDVGVSTFAPEDSTAILSEKLPAQKFGLYFVGWYEDSRDGQNTIRSIFAENGTNNFVDYYNSDLEELLAGMDITDQKERLRLIQKGLEIITEDAALIPLYSKNYNYFVANDVLWEPRIDNDFNMQDAAGLEERIIEEKRSFLSIFGL